MAIDSAASAVTGGTQLDEAFDNAILNSGMNNYSMMQNVLKQFTSALEKQQKEHKQKMDEANAESA
jgi:hypothetical protein